jgi:hypothetical protein
MHSTPLEARIAEAEATTGSLAPEDGAQAFLDERTQRHAVACGDGFGLFEERRRNIKRRFHMATHIVGYGYP